MQPVTVPGGAGAPVKFIVRDWQVNHLAPRGQDGDCQSREVETHTVHFNASADSSLLVTVAPNPGAAVMASGAVEGDGSHVAVRVCNTGSTAAHWETPPTVAVTQLP